MPTQFKIDRFERFHDYTLLRIILEQALAKKNVSTIVTLPLKKEPILKIIMILLQIGVLSEFKHIPDPDSKYAKVEVFFRYTRSGVPTVKRITQLSKPSRQIHINKYALAAMWNHNSIAVEYILSTKFGPMLVTQAIKFGIGGILLYKIEF